MGRDAAYHNMRACSVAQTAADVACIHCSHPPLHLKAFAFTFHMHDCS